MDEESHRAGFHTRNTQSSSPVFSNETCDKSLVTDRSPGDHTLRLGTLHTLLDRAWQRQAVHKNRFVHGPRMGKRTRSLPRPVTWPPRSAAAGSHRSRKPPLRRGRRSASASRRASSATRPARPRPRVFPSCSRTAGTSSATVRRAPSCAPGYRCCGSGSCSTIPVSPACLHGDGPPLATQVMPGPWAAMQHQRCGMNHAAFAKSMCSRQRAA